MWGSRCKHKEVMDKSKKWLELDPDKEEECDPHHSAACSLRLKKQVNDRCWRLSTILHVDDVKKLTSEQTPKRCWDI